MNASTPTLVTQSEFARLQKCDKGYISRLKQAGRLVMVDGKVDVEASRALIAQTAHPNYASKHVDAVPAAGVAQKIALPPPSERKRYKALLLELGNKNLELEQEIRRRQRYPLEAVKHEHAGYGGIMRAGFERLIDQTAPRLAAGDKEERKRILGKEIARLRRLVRYEPVRMMRRLNK